jgi:hypothetical protein
LQVRWESEGVKLDRKYLGSLPKDIYEMNALIKQDYGEIKGKVIEDFSLQGMAKEWEKQNTVLSNGVRILARSRGQKVRGLRHLRHRTKLVVVDNPKDGEWVRTKENRDKKERWLRSEFIGRH